MDADTGNLIAVKFLEFLFVPFGITLLLTIMREILVND